MKHLLKIFFLAVVSLTATTANAQCTFRNTAFKSGEYLSYNLYFNWKFIWVKAGTASMYTVQSRRGGRDIYTSSLVTRSSKRVDKMFMMRDTILCQSTTHMEPTYYRKAAREGKRYYIDEIFYSYPNNNCQIRQHEITSSGEHLWHKKTYDHCVYDMLNIFQRARSFDPSNWKKGHAVSFDIATGSHLIPAKLLFRGKTTVKADNGHKYRCLQLSFMEYEDKKWDRIVDFYITDDQNHIPVRLDMFLRFGSAKAFLSGIKGNRNPITSMQK